MAHSLTRRQVLAAPIALALAAGDSRAQNAPPNIVFLLADDLGYADLSCYGRPDYSTPNLDRLASEGMKFLQAYANSAVCSATRTALITGRYQYRLPVGLFEPLPTGNTTVGLPPDHPTLPSLLKKAGYGTTLLGKWHLGNLPKFDPLKSGYDHFWGFHNGAVDYFSHKASLAPGAQSDLWDDDAHVDQAGYMTTLLGDHAVKIIADYAAARRPFLLSVHFNAPHWPWEGPGDEAESKRIRNLFDFDGGSQKTYARMVQELDAQAGRVLQALENAGIAGNTIVIFTSDNGGERFADTWPFTGKKTELLEGGLRIPALVRWPGHIPGGTTTQQVAISMDWLPTLLAAAGGAPDPAYPPDGMSLLATLTAQAPPVSRKLFWRYNQKAQHAVRDGDMKYLKIRENTFLFNVVDDPLERANLKNREPDVYRRLIQEFEEWNAAMLPEQPVSGGGFTADQLADHFGNERPTRPPGAGRAKQ
ncbi:MAG TPA: sulfatase-like hydrolase/transferase [Bryobacteraceae bacterium]|nr:sulfatase-like hydrolase/transferase [Bryobacteraceae bacterium]